MLSALALALPAVAVYFGLRWMWMRSEIPWHALLGVTVALGLGMGFSSIVYFLLLLFGLNGTTLTRLDAGLWLVLCIGMVILGPRARTRARVETTGEGGPPDNRWLPAIVVLSIGLGLLLLLALGSFWLGWAGQPHGQWDAWSIWNLRARSLARGAPDWPSLFSPIIEWSNPDYPLLLPLTVARLWAYEGRETTAAPAIVAALFSLVSVGFVGLGVARLRGWAAGILSAMVLLATETYVMQGSCQCADVPLGFFVLVGTAFFALYPENRAMGPLFVTAGAAAGLAAWTKNEGILFLAVLLAASVLPARRPRATAFILVGAAAPIAALIVFKWRLAPSNYLFSRQPMEALLQKITDPSRWSVVITGVMHRLTAWGDVSGGALLWLAVAVVLTMALNRRAVARALVGMLLVNAMLAGFVLVYVITPLPLEWQIQTSFGRLFTQLWPALVWSAFQLTGSAPWDQRSSHHSEPAMVSG